MQRDVVTKLNETLEEGCLKEKIPKGENAKD